MANWNALPSRAGPPGPQQSEARRQTAGRTEACGELARGVPRGSLRSAKTDFHIRPVKNSFSILPANVEAATQRSQGRLTAVMRKLVVLLNQLLKNPEFTLA
jgi:hypothetical protein